MDVKYSQKIEANIENIFIFSYQKTTANDLQACQLL